MKHENDTGRLSALDSMLSEDTGFRIELRWDSQNDFLSIVDARGNVWAEVESANDEEGAGETLRRAIDSITKKPVRRLHGYD